MQGVSCIQTLITLHNLYEVDSIKILIQTDLSSQLLQHLLHLLNNQALAVHLVHKITSSWISTTLLKERGDGGCFSIVLCPLLVGSQQIPLVVT